MVVTDPVSGDGGVATFMLPITGTITGTHFWNATYSGNANNNAATAGDEAVTINPAVPGLVTISVGDIVGEPMVDSGTLAGGYFPTGTITFDLLGPSSAIVFTDTVGVNGNGSYTSLGFVPSDAGQYQWEVAYNGDGNNGTATAAEPITVSEPRSVAEPGTFALLGSALAGLGPIRRYRRKSR
jgi:hypothetical protein